MSWKVQIEEELTRARNAAQAGNAGGARVSARRAVGLVVTEFLKRQDIRGMSADVISLLGWILVQKGIPPDVRAAAARLRERVSADFTSRSRDPLSDALLIINHFRPHLER